MIRSSFVKLKYCVIMSGFFEFFDLFICAWEILEKSLWFLDFTVDILLYGRFCSTDFG